MLPSLKADYALRALFDLALHGAARPVTIGQVARRQKIPQKFLELILASLKQAGFVESRRGVEGGYRLARPAEAITVGEVLRFIEGAQARTRRPPEGPFTEVWKKVDEAVAGILDGATLAQVRRAWSEKQAYYVPNWEI
jgi:Rrf2 family protein